MNFNLENQRDVDQLLRIAIKASLKAGKAILKVYDTTIDIEMKEDRSPLTKADKRSHAIISSLLETYGLPLLSEEGRDIPYEERKNWKTFWLVDPLDGTKEFIKRNGEFTVNIALIKNGSPLLGIIFVPVQSLLYFGAPGWNARKMTVQQDDSGNFLLPEIKRSDKLPLESDENSYTVVCSRSHMSEETSALVDDLRKVHPDIQFASKGSSLKLCLVAEGLADIYPRLAPTMEWDTAAGQAIVEHSGGFVRRSEDNQPVVYNKEDLLNPWFIAARTA